MIPLQIDFCNFKAAKYACEKWHYSRSISASRQVHFGVWESNQFVGAVVYGRGANRYIGDQYGLKMTECVELTRVGLTQHQTPTSRIVAITLKLLKRHSPNLRLIVSYADCDQDHHGGIYQAMNWIYQGQMELNGGTPKYLIKGKVWHGRQVYSIYGRGAQRIEWLRANVDPNAELVFTKGKHKYLYPLDDAMRQQIAPLAKPYPKRAGSAASGISDHQSEGDGATPIPALNASERVS